MSILNDYISEDDLERKMEKVLVHEKGRLDETCTECEGLIICHTKECEKGVKKYDKAEVNVLKLELLEKKLFQNNQQSTKVQKNYLKISVLKNKNLLML